MMTTSADIIAIYAAVISTAVAIWNVYACRRDNRLHLSGYATP
jgi:hypothetical protein